MSVKISTGLVRLSYAHVFDAAPNPSGQMKYSTSLLISKSDKRTLARISEALNEVKEDPESKKKWGKAAMKNLRMPLRDGDTERDGDPNYADCYFINASANEDRPPKILDRNRNEILAKDEVYSGCYCQAVITFYAYSASGNNGIGCGLQALRKIKDGTPLGGTVVTDADFDDNDVDESVFGDDTDDSLEDIPF